jgi:hypothetical protein
MFISKMKTYDLALRHTKNSRHVQSIQCIRTMHRKVRGLGKGFTDDWYIHLDVDELHELENIHAGHVQVGDHQVELIHAALHLPEQLQRPLWLQDRRHCTRTTRKCNQITVATRDLWVRN